MKKYMFFLMLTMSFSCSTPDIFENDCGDDVRLGEFELSDTTKAYLPYTGTETLVFLDSLGKSYRLTSLEGLEEVAITLNVNRLCSDAFFIVQSEYYDAEWKHISFQDSTGKNAFDIGIMTTSLDINDPLRDSIFELDSVLVYDNFNLSANELGTGTLYFSIITDERKGQMPDWIVAENELGYRIVGDTMINGKLLKDAILAKRNGSEMYVVYNKQKGIVAFKHEQTGFWVLKD